MKINNPLYKHILSFLLSIKWKDKRHKIPLIWMICGLIQSQKMNISKWIPFVESQAKKAQSTERRFSRWIHNQSICVGDIYYPLIKKAIDKWGNETCYIALDTSMLWNTYCQIRICLIYRGRAVPLVWKTIKHGSSSIALEVYQELLEQTKTLIPENKRVVFLSDRGFVDTNLMRFLSEELQWNWRIRYKMSINAYRKGKRKNKPYCLLKIMAQYGHARFYHNVYVTDLYYGKVHLAFARHGKKRETWLIVSNEPTCLETFSEYGLRFDIEEGFKDDKSGLFQLESSRFRDAEALTRLYLPIAIATLFLISQGVDVVDRGIREEVDPHWKRALSYLKIGLNYVISALSKGLPLITSIILPSIADLEPVYLRKGLTNRKKIEQLKHKKLVFYR